MLFCLDNLEPFHDLPTPDEPDIFARGLQHIHQRESAHGR